MIKKLWNELLQGLGLTNNEDTSDFQNGVAPLPDDVKQAMRDVKEMRQDRDAPNLFVGKFIKDGAITCEVVACTEDDFRITILKIEWDRLGTYLDVGQTYPLHLCFDHQGMRVWEVKPETMKRTTSQVLLAWEMGCGWSWDLDS